MARVPALRDDRQTGAKGRRRWVWGAIGLVALVVAFLVYSRLWMSGARTVVVEISELAPVTRVLAVNGQIAAVRSVTVRPLVSGTLDSLSVAEGDEVAVDQVLGHIDAANQDAVVRQAVAGLDAAREVLQQAAEAHARSVTLGGNVSRTVLEDDAHAERSATQEVARQAALLDQARIALRNHTIRAPMAGSVLSVDVDPGQLVDPSTAMLTLADLGELVVEADVDEAYARQIARDQPAVLQLAGEAGTRSGHVSRVSARVDVATGGLAVRIAFDEPLEAPVGMSVATNIIVERRAAASSLPRTAIVTGEAGSGFFVVDEGRARLRPVTVLDWPADRLIVTAGLSEGDTVIVDAEGLEDGEAVDVVRP